ncbi:MAG: glycosyltransferase family 2 protein [Candidatus Diapherotrites archaeon]|nr:glycosyltransferase family 2 protein [Candidatus Diapherotrites archaeon]
MKKPFVSIIVLNWNGKHYIHDCLQSIKKFTPKGHYEVIVIDNGSKDGSVPMLQRMKQQGFLHKLVLNKENLGFSTGNNQGFKESNGEFFFMLNNDTLVTENWLENLLKAAEKYPSAAAIGAKIIDKPMWETNNYQLLPDRERMTTCGGAMLMRKKAVKKIGVLDAEHFSPIYGEETDWCYRARNSGFKIMETDKSIIIHFGSHDTTKQAGRKKQFILMNTNRLKAMLFNLTLPEFMRHVPGLGLIFVNGLKRGEAVWLLQAYWNNIKNLGTIMRERKKRSAKLF